MAEVDGHLGQTPRAGAADMMTPAFQGCLVMVLALALAALALAFDCCKTRRGGEGMQERVPCVKSENPLGLLRLCGYGYGYGYGHGYGCGYDANQARCG